MQKGFFIYVLLIFSISVSSQQFGGSPPSQHWKQINTDSARIIFPEGLDSQAKRVSSIVHYLAAEKPFSLGDKLKKINFVLQQHTTIPNAYVGLGPFRSELFLTPAPNNFDQGSIAWVDQLALHEYRHVQQFNNFNHGLSSLMAVLFGEEGFALAINAAVPDWFFEGDAVYFESMLSQQGRGRIPQFLNEFPALWQADPPKKYSWMKLRNGSMKDFVPSHYHLGYLMVNYGYEKYGMDFWAKVTRDAAAYKNLFYPFQAAIKKYSGVDYKTFRKDAFEFYKNKLAAPVSKPATVFHVKKNYVTNYYFPYQAGSDSLIYLKTSYRHRPAFFVSTGGKEHKLKVRDISSEQQFSYRNGKIVYSAFETDARWGWRDYSVLKLIDTHTGRQRSLSSKSKYFTPDISPDGNRVAAVQNDVNGRSELHIINVSDGQLIKTIHAADISLFTDPKFIDDQNLVTAVRLRDGKMALALAEIETGNTMRLTLPSYNVIGYPVVDKGVIYYTASYNGNDDVYALRLSDKKISRITNGPLGNYFVNASNGKITWSTFTAEGYQLVQMDEKDLVMEEAGVASVESLVDKFSVPASNDILLNKVPYRDFPVTKYKKGKELINLHSWRPNFTDPVFTFSIYGQNVLNTLQTEIYYQYHLDEETHAVGFSSIYGAWFPYITLGSEFTFNRRGRLGNKIRQWNQLDSRIGMSIPISKISGQTYKDFNIGSYYVLRNEFNQGFFADSMGNTSFGYLLHSASWTQQVQRAVQHIYPRYAFSLASSYRHAISYYEGYQFYGSASIFVPGFLSTHNLNLTGAFQQRDTNYVLFSTRFATARGYADYYGTTAGSRLTRLSANYHLPLILPDWGFGNILYIMRLRANIFYDHQKIFSNDRKNSAELRSTGVEFFADTKWWNEYPLTFGIRFSYLLDNDPLARNGKGNSIFEFVLPVSLIPR